MSEDSPRRAGWCAVPTAAMLLPDVGPVQPSEVVKSTTFAAITLLRQQLVEVMEAAHRGALTVAGIGATTLVVPDDAWSLTVAPVADLGPVGIAIRRDCRQADAPVGAAGPVTSSQHAARYVGDAAVVAMHVTSHRPDVPLRCLGVPVDATAAEIGDVARWLTEQAGPVVAAGDLAATLDVTSPGYHVEGAIEWDAAVQAMFDDPQPWTEDRREAFDALGGAAARFLARGHGPLRVLAALCARQRVSTYVAAYAAPRGVGQLAVGIGSRMTAT